MLMVNFFAIHVYYTSRRWLSGWKEETIQGLPRRPEAGEGKVRAESSQVAFDTEFPFWELGTVRVISRRAIREFAERHPEALEPPRHWANAAESVDWRTPGDVRRTFNTADFAGDLTVFNIGGNKYRVIAFVHYRQRAICIKDVLTHKDYD